MITITLYCWMMQIVTEIQCVAINVTVLTQSD